MMYLHRLSIVAGQNQPKSSAQDMLQQFAVSTASSKFRRAMPKPEKNEKDQQVSVYLELEKKMH